MWIQGLFQMALPGIPWCQHLLSNLEALSLMKTPYPPYHLEMGSLGIPGADAGPHEIPQPMNIDILKAGRGWGPKTPSLSAIVYEQKGKLTQGADGQKRNQGISSSLSQGCPRKQDERTWRGLRVQWGFSLSILGLETHPPRGLQAHRPTPDSHHCTGAEQKQQTTPPPKRP